MKEKIKQKIKEKLPEKMSGKMPAGGMGGKNPMAAKKKIKSKKPY